ncbi:MAG TPA: hypothetical protein VMV57_06260 [Terracidiphilus sp.]|nr:hypothetical protein [Terracidiphilus sp.]
MTGYFNEVAIPVIAAAIGAAVGSVVTVVFTPLAKRVWRAYRVRRFDPKDAHYKELQEEAKWFEGRAAKLAAFRMNIALNQSTSDRFRLAELISKLDRKDAEWVRQTEVALLSEATEKKQVECQDNAAECARLADEVTRRIFW